MRNAIATILSAAALAATVVTAGAQETVNYGVQPATQPIYIARALGLLDEIEKKHDVKIEFQTFSYGAPQNQAMAAGAIDISSAGMGPAIVAAARLPAKLVAISILEQTAILVPTDSEVRSVADLKGKRVAFPGEGSQQYPLLLRALADAGLEESDIELFKTKGSDIPTLLMQKSVDAGITWDPHVSKALAEGSARVLIKAEKILPIKQGHYIGNGEYARTEFIEAHPELVQDLVNANVKAIEFIVANPDEAAKMWSEEIGFPKEVIDFSLREGISVYSTDVVPADETIEAYTAFLKSAGILEETDNPATDPSFAIKALGATN